MRVYFRLPPHIHIEASCLFDPNIDYFTACDQPVAEVVFHVPCVSGSTSPLVKKEHVPVVPSEVYGGLKTSGPSADYDAVKLFVHYEQPLRK